MRCTASCTLLCTWLCAPIGRGNVSMALFCTSKFSIKRKKEKSVYYLVYVKIIASGIDTGGFSFFFYTTNDGDQWLIAGLQWHGGHPDNSRRWHTNWLTLASIVTLIQWSVLILYPDTVINYTGWERGWNLGAIKGLNVCPPMFTVCMLCAVFTNWSCRFFLLCQGIKRTARLPVSVQSSVWFTTHSSLPWMTDQLAGASD